MSDSELFADRMLSPGLARVSEAAAIAAAQLIGRGDDKSAGTAAVDAMRILRNLPDSAGTGVIGESERDEAPMLYIGEHVGMGNGPGGLFDHCGLTAQGIAASGRRALAHEAQRCASAREAQ